MNIINSALLRFALLPSPIYGKMGVDTKHLKVILTAKLLMDDRRPNTFQQIQRRKNNKPISLATLGTMMWSAFMGLIFLMSFTVGKTYETKFTIYFSFYVAILASILIADFTSVLIDVRDNFIILPKPVSDKTFVVSRLLHIFIYVCKLVIPMILPAAVMLIINKNVLAIIPFLFVILMATLFTIFLINACYILILKITTPSKFKNVISYLQIIFAVIFYAGYQLVPQLMQGTLLSQYELNERPGIMFLPTYWFAGAWQQLYTWNGTLQLWTCLALTIIVPLLSIWVVIKYFAPSFNRKLSMITGDTAETSAADKHVRKNPLSAYSTALAKLFTKSSVERTSFLFTWKMMLRSRSFKMKVYPAIGYMVVIIFLLFIRNKTISFNDIAAQTKEGIYYSLIVIYLSMLIVTSAVTQLTVYEKYKAAWIFFITPVDKPGRIISAAVKAAIAQFFFPLVTVIVIVLTALAGPVIIPNIVLGVANDLLIIVFAAYINLNKLPFSSPQQTNSGGSIIRVFAVMIFGFLLAALHFFLYPMTIVVSILAVLSLTATWYILGSLNNLSWTKIYSSYSDDQ